MQILHCSKSMSRHLSCRASPDLAPVSLSSCRNVEVFFPQQAIKASMSFSSGVQGFFACSLYFGFVHVSPMNLANLSQVFTAKRLVLLLHVLVLAMTSFTDSGSQRLAPLFTMSLRVFAVSFMVLSEFPFRFICKLWSKSLVLRSKSSGFVAVASFCVASKFVTCLLLLSTTVFICFRSQSTLLGCFL